MYSLGTPWWARESVECVESRAERVREKPHRTEVCVSRADKRKTAASRLISCLLRRCVVCCCCFVRMAYVGAPMWTQWPFFISLRERESESERERARSNGARRGVLVAAIHRRCGSLCEWARGAHCACYIRCGADAPYPLDRICLCGVLVRCTSERSPCACAVDRGARCLPWLAARAVFYKMHLFVLKLRKNKVLQRLLLC